MFLFIKRFTHTNILLIENFKFKFNFYFKVLNKGKHLDKRLNIEIINYKKSINQNIGYGLVFKNLSGFFGNKYYYYYLEQKCRVGKNKKKHSIPTQSSDNISSSI